MPARARQCPLVRAEVASPSSFLLVVENVTSPALLSSVLERLQQACPGAQEALARDLSSSEQCRLDAEHYQALNEALQAAGAGSPFRWVPLPRWVQGRLHSFGGLALAAPSAPQLWLPEGLMPYQRLGVQRAVAQGGRILLADEMGLGKTAQALAVMAQYLDEEGPALVVTPSSIGAVWKEQAFKWLPRLRPSEVQLLRGIADRPLPQARIVVVSYALFVRDAKAFACAPGNRPWQIVACDEAHYLRNPTSQRGKALLPLLQAARRCVLVSGTPAPKQACEAFSLLHALQPLGCEYKEWCARYGSERTEHREAEVAAMLSEVMVRRMKAEVLDQLPPKHRQRILLQLPASKLAMMRKLSGKEGDEEHFRQLAHAKEAAVQEYTEYLLAASRQHKFLLFAHHISVLDALERTVKKQEVNCIRIDGSTPVQERPGLVRRFQEDEDCRVAVLAVLAAGEGLTFTAASLCVFCELCPAVPGVIEQAEARVHRIGQQAAGVDVHFLVVEGTRDAQVFSRLESRSGAVSRAVGDAAGDASAPGPVAAACPAAATGRKRGVQDAPVRKKKKPAMGMEALLSAGISKAQAELVEDAPLAKLEDPVDPACQAREREREEYPVVPVGAPKKRAAPQSRQPRSAAKRRAKAEQQPSAPSHLEEEEELGALADPVQPCDKAAALPQAGQMESVTKPAEAAEAEEEEEDKDNGMLALLALGKPASDAKDAQPETADAEEDHGEDEESGELEDTSWFSTPLRPTGQLAPQCTEAPGEPQGAPKEAKAPTEQGKKALDPLAALLDGLIDAARSSN